jgi:hypothetical protein
MRWGLAIFIWALKGVHDNLRKKAKTSSRSKYKCVRKN